MNLSVNFEPVWSIPSDVHKDISLHPSAEGYLVEASDILKKEIIEEKRELIGYVYHLRRKEEEKGEIKILTFDEEGEVIPVTIKPNDKSYQLAIDAHKDFKMIRVTGILEKIGRKWCLNEPEEMEIINEDYEYE